MALIKVALILGLLSSVALQPLMGVASPTSPASPTHYQGEQASDRFKQTLSGLKSIEAHFSQRVFQSPELSTQGRALEAPAVLQSMQGTMALKRPNHFRWESEDPYPQTIITEGELIYLYDRDLDQVTVKQLDDQLGNTPALLISGDVNAVDEHFDVRLERVGVHKGGEQHTYILTPKQADAAFNQIQILFKDGVLSAMLLDDPLGQRTEITFTDVEQNRRLSESLFQFTPPPGVDLIRDY